jgi:hypothetical protein
MAYGAQILDVPAAVGAVDQVLEQSLSISVVQCPVDKR